MLLRHPSSTRSSQPVNRHRHSGRSYAQSSVDHSWLGTLKRSRSVTGVAFPRSLPTQSEALSLTEVASPLSTHPQLRPHLSAALQEDGFDPEFVLLLLVATALEKLVIDIPGNEVLNPDEALRHSKSRAKPGDLVLKLLQLLPATGYSQKLVEIKIFPWFWQSWRDGIPLRVPWTLFGLDQLRSLSLAGLVKRFHPPDRPFDENISNIRYLHISKCDVRCSTLVSMLSSCVTLEDICTRWDGGFEGTPRKEDWAINVNYAALGKALEKHTGTLRALVLDTMSDGLTYITQTPGIGPLLAFNKLESLEIDDSILIGDASDGIEEESYDTAILSPALREFFPPNLKSFKLHTRQSAGAIGDVRCAVASDSPTSLEQLAITFYFSRQEVKGRALDILKEDRRAIEYSCSRRDASDV